MFAKSKRVAGTEGTGDYVVITENKLGLVAVRHLGACVGGEASYRVRVQPADAAAAAILAQYLPAHQFPSPHWKQPGEGGQDRFSTVVSGGKALHTAVGQAIDGLKRGGYIDEEWEGALSAVAMVGTTRRSELVDRVRAAHLAGVNGAGNWTTTTLMAKLVVADTPEGERDALVSRVRGAKVAGANLAVTWSLATLRRKSLFLK